MTRILVFLLGLLALGAVLAGPVHAAHPNPASGGYLTQNSPAPDTPPPNALTLLGKSHADPDIAPDCCTAPNGGAGAFRPTQPLGSDGAAIIRTNNRGSEVLIQPNGSVTCGQHACGMVLNTRGQTVAVDDLIASHPPDVRRRFGYRRVHVMLERQGWQVNQSVGDRGPSGAA